MVKRCPECNEVVRPPYKECDNCGFSPRKKKSERGSSRREKPDRKRRDRGGRPPRREEEEPKRRRRPPKDEDEEPKRRRRPSRDEEPKRKGRRPRDEEPKRKRRPPREEKKPPRKGRRPPREEEEEEPRRRGRERPDRKKKRAPRREREPPRRREPEPEPEPEPVAEYDPDDDPKVKEFDEAIQGIEEEIENLKEEVEEKNVLLKGLEEEMSGKKKEYDDLLKEKEEIEGDLEATLDCPKCGTGVELPETTEATLHLSCDDCGAKGRLPNPNRDVYLDLEDIDEEIAGLKTPLDEFDSRISDINSEIDDAKSKVKNRDEELEMKKEEREEHIEEKRKEGPVAQKPKKPSRERERPPKKREPVEDDYEEEDEYDEDEQEPEDAFCPMCYADLVEPPYNKCPGCGWEEEADYSEEPSAYDSYAEEYDEPAPREPIDDFGTRFEEADRYDPGDRRKAAKEHYQVPCRCGATIDIWTSKRPTKIHCEECGAKGMLKGMGKKVSDDDDFHGDFKYEKSPDYGRDEPAKAREEAIFCGNCGARNVGNKFCFECGDPLGKEDKKPSKPKRGKGRRPPRGEKPKRPERGRKGRRPPKREKKVSMEELEEKAVDILVKLEKLLDKAANKNIYFPEIEDEMDGLEGEIEDAKSVDELEAIISKAKKLGNKVNRKLKK